MCEICSRWELKSRRTGERVVGHVWPSCNKRDCAEVGKQSWQQSGCVSHWQGPYKLCISSDFSSYLDKQGSFWYCLLSIPRLRRVRWNLKWFYMKHWNIFCRCFSSTTMSQKQCRIEMWLLLITDRSRIYCASGSTIVDDFQWHLSIISTFLDSVNTKLQRI